MLVPEKVLLLLVISLTGNILIKKEKPWQAKEPRLRPGLNERLTLEN